jgi:leader peptidase (prepilin peptidase)/N-methyltransferase
MADAPYDWIIALIMAPFIGSFLSVLVVRLPKREDVVTSRSRCRACGKTLSPLELVPIVSWVVQGGKCRSCGAKVDWLYPALELGAALMVLWAMSVGLSGAMLWATCVLGWALLALAVMDLRDMMLADALTLPLIAGGLGVIAVWQPDALIWHLAGAIAGFALMVGIAHAYRAVRGRDGLGFGDAKLMAGAGAWTGLLGLGTVLLYGSLLSLAGVAVARAAGRPIGAETPLPFGAGLAAGFWLTWLYGPLLLG